MAPRRCSSTAGVAAAATTLLALLVVPQAAVTAGPARSTNPHIVFILADDMGFNELGYRNTSRGLQTPNIDALAAGGVTLSRYYTTPLCSPSRSSLMTGIYNHRIGTQANVIYWDTPLAPSLNFT